MHLQAFGDKAIPDAVQVILLRLRKGITIGELR